jgi:Protein of unknown function (DUF2796)
MPSHTYQSIARWAAATRSLAALALVAIALPTPGPAAAQAPSQRSGHAHQHGVAKLDVAIDGQRIDFELEMPLDNLVGFERAPRNADEKRRVDAAIASLRAADALFRIDPAAGCTLREVNLSSAVLKLGDAASAAAPAPDDGHADIDADIGFDCKDATAARQVQLGLFNAFSRLQRLEVQVATPKRQFKRSLKRPDGQLGLAP